MDDLHALETWAGGLLSRLAPPARRKLLAEIARELRRGQARRIATQRNPDGSAFTKRKPRSERRGREKKGRMRQAAMFAKLRRATYLRMDANAAEVVVGFEGRAARIARVHQLGERSQVAVGGSEYEYPQRVLLGLTRKERGMILDKITSII